ncbi:hypothetical protein KSP40_PGU007606 [Platanthera guangdongensis]|uniref:Uncharacterized protein n=1 Tax=Platanthera guangdongensis TaxID=2320717 RepID=A0ABR2LYX9_9ASPA
MGFSGVGCVLGGLLGECRLQFEGLTGSRNSIGRGCLQGRKDGGVRPGREMDWKGSPFDGEGLDGAVLQWGCMDKMLAAGGVRQGLEQPKGRGAVVLGERKKDGDIALVKNNAYVGAKIAVALAHLRQRKAVMVEAIKNKGKKANEGSEHREVFYVR